MKVSIIIKAFNEEKFISRAIESSLSALDKVGGGEVILSDSLSVDRTLELAKKYPIRIVQLVNIKDRCCGIGAELGYRVACGEYIYIIDGDMELDGDFLKAATKQLDADNNTAAVAGLIQEMNVANGEFRGRVASSADHLKPGEVDRLNGGGLYRKSAIDELGYLTNKNLHAFEEYELGLRLRKKGFLLKRLNMISVKHYGYTDSSLSLLWKRWKERYSWGAGELLRDAIKNDYINKIFIEIAIFKKSIMVLVWWNTIVLFLISSVFRAEIAWMIFALVFLPMSLTALRRRSLIGGMYVILFVNLFALGIIAGFFSNKQVNPRGAISMRVVQ